MKIQLLSINYAPERTGIAPYSTLLAEYLARTHDVTVITGTPHYPDWRVEPEHRAWRRVAEINGVKIVRLSHYVPSRPNLPHRAAYEATWASRAYATARRTRADVVLATIPALLSGAVATRIAERSGAACGLIVQDLMRSAAAQVGMRGAAWTTRATTSVERAAVRRADGIVTIDNKLAEVLRIDASSPVEVIPNWSHVAPVPPELVNGRNDIRQRYGWRDDTVVLHSGNMGLKQNLENVIDAARYAERAGLKLRFVLAGGGSQLETLARRGAGCSTLSIVPAVPDGDYLSLLGAADVLLVNERPGMTEMSLPSKITSYLRAGRPVLAATDAGSVTSSLIDAMGGVRVDAGKPDELVLAAAGLAANADKCATVVAQQTRYLETHLLAEPALERYGDWVERLAARRRLSLRAPFTAVAAAPLPGPEALLTD